jgi:GNAT superfamily N-acetyltransferase
MVREGPAPGVASGATAEVWSVDEQQLVAFQRLAFADDAGIDPAVPGAAAAGCDQAEPPALADRTQALLRAGTAWRGFGAGATDGGLPACTATLYLDSDVGARRVAFVDQVATLRAFRERGLARAVMLAALSAASAWEADLVALFADADDWPQVFYSSLGFVTVGRQTVFHRGT